MGQSQRSSHLKRYRQIAEVLARHGLGSLLSGLGLERFVALARRLSITSPQGQPASNPEHLRMALEELGATFIKLGQILSTRADLLPIEYQTELAKLQDQASPVAPSLIEQTLQAELGCSLAEAFATFDHEPLAAASIGQVHAATLHNGVEVVVKVRRPGVVECIEEDLAIIQSLAAIASRRWTFAEQYDLPALAQEFASTLRSELDYIREGQSVQRFAANFKANPSVHIPLVFWETTTAHVLTLERIRGIKINDLAALDAAGIDRQALAERATHLLLQMVFEDGFFHADPHPGNFFIEPGGRIGLIDFGMVGTVDAPTQEQLVDLLLAITSQQSDRLVDALLMLSVTRQRVDRSQLHRDLDHLLQQYYGRPLREIALGSLLREAFTIIQRHHLQLPPNLALLCKTLIMDEGLGTQLDPTFNLAQLLAPYARRLLLQQYAPALWFQRLGQASLDARRLGVEFPQQLRRLLRELEDGNLEIGMRPAAWEPLVRRFEKAINRLVFAMLIAAFVNGLAILALAYLDHPFGAMAWLDALFLIGFVLASAIGVFLAWSILRSRR